MRALLAHCIINETKEKAHLPRWWASCQHQSLPPCHLHFRPAPHAPHPPPEPVVAPNPATADPAAHPPELAGFPARGCLPARCRSTCGGSAATQTCLQSYNPEIETRQEFNLHSRLDACKVALADLSQPFPLVTLLAPASTLRDCGDSGSSISAYLFRQNYVKARSASHISTYKMLTWHSWYDLAGW